MTALWRRLDAPGHDACRLQRSDTGWQIDGTAVFREDELLARLEYRVQCGVDWVTREGHVRGWLGGQAVDLAIARTGGGVWTVNGGVVHGLDACVDLDLGFTPATNLLQLRRVALAEGQAAEVPVAWLDVRTGTLELLAQRYERRAGDAYWYEAARFGYAGVLQVTPVGVVRLYPGLWELEP